MEALCKGPARSLHIAAITNDIYTKEDAEILMRSGALPPERIMGVETGGCPHTGSMNLAAVVQKREQFPKLDLVLIESGADNLAAGSVRSLRMSQSMCQPAGGRPAREDTHTFG